MSVFSSDKVNAFVLKEVYREELKEWFGKLEGTKVLVCEDSFVSTFELIVDNAFLKECGIVHRTTLNQSTKKLPKSQHVVIVCKPSILLMDVIYNFINKEESGNEFSSKNFHLLFVPNRSLLCEKRLKELGLLSSLSSTDHLEFDIIPLASDLLSMEWPDAYKECYLEQDNSCLLHVCKSITTLQSLFGPIPNLYAKGNLASKVVDMLLRMHKELSPSQSNVPCKIDNLLVLDRQVDALTPLLTPLTYEGLLDELFHIKQGVVELPAERFTCEQPPNQATHNPFDPPTLKKIHLDPLDDLYAEIRDKNFNAVGNCINQRVKNLSSQYDERHAAKTVGEIKKFVAKITHIRSTKANLATHTAIAEMIKEVTDEDDFRSFLAEQQECLEGDADRIKPYIEESIALKRPLIKVLRLICLQCFVNSGLKPKVLEFYKKEIIQTYGFQHLVSLHNMERSGLMYQQGALKTFPLLRKQLKLTVKDVNEQKPDDISYVYSGYAPISVRLAQILNKTGWRSISEVVNTMLPGAVKEESQPIPEWLVAKGGADKRCKVTLVFLVGGLTYAEVSALRFLSQQDDCPSEYLIATTHIINSSTYLQSIMHDLKPKPPNPFL